mmetsp:Transcript_21111/g.20297  ORF Transcript_21111/g.20297 Transcript_21111/m.20297 type:complete len:86 (-) Transcript_21111:47-304(-)
MDDSRFFMEIFHCTQKLKEIEACKFLIEGSLLAFGIDELEKVSLFNKFQDNEEYLDGLACWFDDDLPFAIVVNKFNDVGVVHLFK